MRPGLAAPARVLLLLLLLLVHASTGAAPAWGKPAPDAMGQHAGWHVAGRRRSLEREGVPAVHPATPSAAPRRQYASTNYKTLGSLPERAAATGSYAMHVLAATTR
jgi:hypothetical protein